MIIEFAEQVETPPLPDWVIYLLSDSVILPAVFWIIAILALIVVIYRLWPVISKFVQIIDKVSDLPTFIREMEERSETDDTWRAEVNSWRETTSEQIQEIHHQTHTNGGGSIKDDVVLIKRTVETMSGDIVRLRDDFEAADDLLREELEATQETKRDTHE